MRGRKFDLIGDYALRRAFPWRLSVRRLQPGPARKAVDLTGMSARFEIYDNLCARRPPWTFAVVIDAPPTGGGLIDMSADDTRAIQTTAARYRLLFTDSLGDESVLLTGRLAVLESDR